MATQSGLTEAEAKEFHEQFKTTYTAFVAIAAVAHLLVFAWKPWDKVGTQNYGIRSERE